MQKIAVITGPTASGKSSLAMKMAMEFGGEIISADSMQIYREMDIGTAKPTLRDRTLVPHHMIDIADPGEVYSAARYLEDAGKCIEDVLSRGKLAIVCGGTGLYINALLSGVGFSGGDTEIRAELEKRWDHEGPEAIMAQLRECDPASAERLHINDKKRIIRALEVWLSQGVTITEMNERERASKPLYDPPILALRPEPRELLYRRIDLRVDQMMEEGLEREVRKLLSEGKLTGTAAQAIGYKELLSYIAGESSLGEAVELLKRKSRNYAKRQLTWFRGDERVSWLTYEETDDFEQVFAKATDFFVRSGLQF